MPAQNEIREFEHALQRARRYAAQYDQVSSYLDEAERCFKAECYRAAIVMLWCAVSARLNEDVERLGAAGFLKSGRDIEILRICSEELGILTKRRSDTLRRCLGDRNNCAHPSPELYGASEVVGYFQDLNRALFGYTLSISLETFKKILLTEDHLSPGQADFLIARLRINQRARRLPHALIDKYFGAGPRIREKIRLVWQVEPSTDEEESEEPPPPRLREHLKLSEEEKTHIMRHFVHKLETHRSDHQPTEIAQIVFWEVLSDDEASGKIYEYFLSQKEHLTVTLLHRVREHAPDGYKEQFAAVLSTPR
ncbi:MAG: hypothetical protein DRP08_03830 [Candidatus Aenigmatarchaeota archaeon]|nr:MAG: hypothetical protein DRP08_03830 [Candidatus Aenigmarchaeota archaeon]